MTGILRGEERLKDLCDELGRHSCSGVANAVSARGAYAILMDMFRVRMEARRVLALTRFHDGDYDGALEHASEALSVAARFGFVLRKNSLRILVAQILVRRGTPISGNAMLKRASRTLTAWVIRGRWRGCTECV